MPLLMKVPLVLWGDKAPSHRIKCICVCQSGIIVTGSIEGQLVFWNIYNENGEFKIFPQNMILAHSCSVESVVSIYNEKLGINSGVISLSDNQEICLWNADTGCCLFKVFLQGRYHTLHILYKRQTDVLRESLVACYGSQNSIAILDPFTLQVLLILKQPFNSNFLNTIKTCCFIPSLDSQIDDKLVAMTYGGSFVTWVIPGKINTGAKYTQLFGKHESINICEDKEILFMAIESFGLKHLVFATKSSIYLYRYPELKLFFKFSLNNKIISGLEFVSKCNFMVCFLNSDPVIFKINDEGKAFDHKIQYLTISSHLKSHHNKITNLATSFQYQLENKTHCCLIFGNDNSGQLNLWVAGKYNDSKEYLVDYEGDLMLNSANSMMSIWSIAKPFGLANNFTKSLKQETADISCSIQLHEFGFMILGLKSGIIAVISTIELAMQQLLETHKDDVVPYLTLIGHYGPVTSLCYPYDECNKHDPCHLISGGSDFSIRLWNIVSRVQLKCFYPHGGFIQDLFVATAEFTGAADLAIVSVASDYSVALINPASDKELLVTRCHTSPVYSVKWRAKEDLVLVLCSDGTLFVWDIITGNLERCITGRNAIDIFEISEENSGKLHECDRDDYVPPPVIVHLEDEEEHKHKRPLSFKDLRHKSKSYQKHNIDFEDGHTSKKHSMKHVFRKISIKSRGSKSSKSEKDVKPAAGTPQSSALTPGQSIFPTQNSTSGTSLVNPNSYYSSAANLAASTQTLPTSSQTDENGNICCINSCPPFDVLSVRTGYFDSQFHILLIDSDVLINQLLSDEEMEIYKLNSSRSLLVDTRASLIQSSIQVQQNLTNPSQSLSLLVLTLGLCPTTDSKTYHKYCKSLQLYHSIVLENTALLLISCLHPWGADSDLDKICFGKLGLSKPAQSVSFGFVSHNRFQLSAPRIHSDSISSGITNEENVPDVIDPSNENTLMACTSHIQEIEKYMFHWQVSTVMTTQHIVIIVALTDAFLQLNTFLLISEKTLPIKVLTDAQSKDRFSQRPVSSKSLPSSRFSTEVSSVSVPDLSRRTSLVLTESESAVSWKLLHSQHSRTTTCLMRDHINYQPPLIQELIFYWMDSCEEIRNASYGILIAELSHISSNNRQNLIRSWSTYLPDDNDAENSDIEKSIVLPLDDYIESGGFYGFWPCDKRSQQTLAIFLISFIASEFSAEFDPLTIRSGSQKDCALTINMLRTISIIFTKILNSHIKLENFSFFSIRRACLFLLGRSFGIWQNYLNISQVIMTILDATATLILYMQFFESNNKMRAQSYIYCSELLKSHRSCLIEIIISYPEMFITMLNKEMTRYNNETAYATMGHAAMVVAAVYSNNRKQQNPLTSAPSVLQTSRNEVIILLEALVDKAPDRARGLLLELIDLLLHCGAHRLLKKDSNIMKTFPFLLKFNMIDYCENSRKLAVGTKKGQFGIYDIKNQRCHIIETFSHPITCLKFSPDGRNLVIYCYDELKISLFHLHTSLLGLGSSMPKPGTTFHLKQQKSIRQDQLYKIHFGWESNNSFKLIFDKDYDLMFTM